MNFRQLRYCVTLSEELSFSRAARRLFISQPSLSQCVQEVEAGLETRLFERAGGRVSLTPAGKKYVEIAREILALADRLQDEVTRMGQNGQERLRIGVSDSGSIMTPMLLPELQARFPEVQFSFVEQPVAELEDRVVKGELDLIFTMQPVRQREKLEILPILRDDFLIACPRSFPVIRDWLAANRGPDPALEKAHPESAPDAAPKSAPDAALESAQKHPLDYPQTEFPALPLPLLLSLPFITVKLRRFELEMSLKMSAPDAFRPNVIMEVANVITALSMVAAGNGVCPVPATIIRLGVQDPRVFYCRIDQLFPTCELAVSFRKGTKLSEAAQAYVDLLRVLVRERHLDQ